MLESGTEPQTMEFGLSSSQVGSEIENVKQAQVQDGFSEEVQIGGKERQAVYEL